MREALGQTHLFAAAVSGRDDGRSVILRGQLLPHIEAAHHARQSRLVRLASGAEVFVEYIAPPRRLVLFGAGHDAMPVAALAKQIGWQVTVADGRPAYITAARFPTADRLVVLKPREPFAGIGVDRDTLVVLMTHNYPLDLVLLKQLLPLHPRYLGVLGPRKRFDRLCSELSLTRDDFDVHSPLGLDIGAELPQGIAVAIVAEIQAELSSRPGMKLRHRRAPIHEPVLTAGDLAQPGMIPDAERAYAACEVSRT